MYYLYYDGSFAGFLTAVFDVYELRLKAVAIRKEVLKTDMLFTNNQTVIKDEAKVKRVAAKLENLLGKEGLLHLWAALLSEYDTIEDALLEVVRYALKEQKNVLSDFGHPAVLEVQQTVRKVHREKHRMLGFVRFQLAKDGIYYAFIEPDFDILPLIARHFTERFSDQQWLIYDLKRNKGLFYDLKKTELVAATGKDSEKQQQLKLRLDPAEEAFQSLWKAYFKHTAIPSRKNTKLHLQFLPKRYWQYLPEKKPDL